MKTRVMLGAVVLVALVAGFYAFASSSNAGRDDRQPAIVGSVPITRAMIDQHAHGDPAGRAVVADQLIERAWLQAEADRRGIAVRDVADVLAGPRAAGIPRAFEQYHARQRAMTLCLAEFHDPYADRCSDRAPAPEGSCRWMGEATLCAVGGVKRRSWLIVVEARGRRVVVARTARRVVARFPARLRRQLGRAGRVNVAAGAFDLRLTRRSDAVAAARSIYLEARTVRERRERAQREQRARRRRAARLAAARRERVAQRAAARRERRERLAAARAARRERRAQVAAARAARMADPLLSATTLATGRGACTRYRAAVEPYSFGLGLQDPLGQADGILAARAAVIGTLRRSAADPIDVLKLRPLVRRVRTGDRMLHALKRAARAESFDALTAAAARFERSARAEERIVRRLGLGNCLGSPAETVVRYRR